MKPNPKSSPALGLTILFIQVFDIVIHVLSHQAEIIRITSNVLVMAWIIAGIYSLKPLNRLVGIAVLILYLALNVVFIIQAGLLNPYGGYRTVFFILISLTVWLSVLFIRKTHKP